MDQLIEGMKYTDLPCTCDTPCCEVDVGIGFVTCSAQHCPVHATPENQGVPGGRTYQEGSLYGIDTVQGKTVGSAPHDQNRMDEFTL